MGLDKKNLLLFRGNNFGLLLYVKLFFKLVEKFVGEKER